MIRRHIFDVDNSKIFISINIAASHSQNFFISCNGMQKIILIIIAVCKIKPACCIIFIFYNSFKNTLSFFKFPEINMAKTEHF